MSNDSIVIIGSGAGGGMAAKLLAEQGHDVKVLEKGQDFYSYTDETAQKIESTNFSNDELKFRSRYLTLQDPLIEPRTLRDIEGVAQRAQVSPTDVAVGGSTITYGAIARRVHPYDFTMLSNYGSVGDADLADWPIDYNTLEPFYSAAELIIGVQGSETACGANPDNLEDFENPFQACPRSIDHPMTPGAPKVWQSNVSDASTRLGYHPFPAPAAINSREYGWRPACNNCGFCTFFGCPIHAKGSTAVTALLDAKRAGCAVYSNCFVYRIEPRVPAEAPAGNSGYNVHYIDDTDNNGERKYLSASKVILACGAIESARLCLLSGLGNEHVGRNLMIHTESVAAGFFRESLHSYRGRNITLAIDDFIALNLPNLPDTENIIGGGCAEFGGHLFPIEEAAFLPITGEPHDFFMRLQIAREHQLSAVFIGEALPVYGNRVELDDEVIDVYGQSVARINYQPNTNDKNLVEFVMPKLEEILSEAGAFATFAIDGTGSLANAYHQLGTLRMGTEPDVDHSVVDSKGKFHGYENLYCVDASLFPTSTSYDPVLTVFALALYVSASMIDASDPKQLLNDLVYPESEQT